MYDCGEFENDSWVMIRGYSWGLKVIGVRKVDGWIAVWNGQDAGTLVYVDPNLLIRIEPPTDPQAEPDPRNPSVDAHTPKQSSRPRPNAPGDTSKSAGR